MRFAELVGSAGLILFAYPWPVPAEEICLATGQRIEGTVTLAPDGRLGLSAGGKPLALQGVVQVRFPVSARLRPVAATHQLLLPQGQRLTGEWLASDAQDLQ